VSFSILLGPVYSIGVVPNNQSIILSTGDKSLTILDIDKKKIDFLENVHRRKMERSFYTLISTLGTIRCVAVSRDGKFFASCSDDRCIKIFDWETKEVIHWFKDVHKGIFEIKHTYLTSFRSILSNHFQSRLQISHYRIS